MFWQKGKGVKTLKILRTLKKGVPVADPTHGEHTLGLCFWVCCSRWNFSILSF